ncbi:biotin carboxylase N-terminal domain-containing protein [Limnobacter sp.]|uniref:acetyl/propionyl/methylcrotonyl-CoA carboxylase subunit alpha n=1 Tax=Limnobacter sp. TaxID=2003368 RepID=UPI0035163783
MFQTLLIANRGEIARRINRTAQAMGLRTVAVYSQADANALHVRECDEAVCLGEPAASASYLNIAKIIEAAQQTGAQAIHPGYGFLSENADFAQACADAGLVFVGPGVDAIRIMGSKSEAKACVAKAGVPLIPGYFGADQSLPTLQREADRIGYPLMIKAVAGGGGKGIRAVHKAEDLQSALQSCQREAANAFGDASVMLEKLIIQPRHVEVQVFADTHGNVVHLFERDCSAQRRHQKVIEEAPAWGLSDEQRQALGATAVQVARAVHYVGAGTVEFLMDASGAFYFMEMNTRLQVEHPVTEMITGFDLVQWQLDIAAGKPLPAQQSTIHIDGHAFEARLYAENPEQGFLPAIGQVALWESPSAVEFTAFQHRAGKRDTAGLRLDGAMASGLEVAPHYDPMVGKLIAWGPNRDVALNRLAEGLARLRCVGVKNNLAWLRSLCLHPEFVAGGYDTGLIDRMQNQTKDHAPAMPIDQTTLHALAGLARWAQAVGGSQAGNPLAQLDGFHQAAAPLRVDHWQWHSNAFSTRTHVRAMPQAMRVTLPQGQLELRVHSATQAPLLRLTGEVLQGPHAGACFDLIWLADQLHVHVGSEQAVLAWQNPAHIQADQGEAGHGVAAPMPGKVFAVFVEVGESVKKGQPLIGLEAMKMEHTLTSPRDGVVQAIPHPVGDQVLEGTELIHFEEEQ